MEMGSIWRDEQSKVEEIAQKKDEKRTVIMLVSGPCGSGKSYLLEKGRDFCQGQVVCGLIDLSNKESVEEMLRKLYNELSACGKPLKFNYFLSRCEEAKQLDAQKNMTVNIEKNITLGNSRNDITLSNNNQGLIYNWNFTYTEAFLQDISEFNSSGERVVLAFDTFNDTTVENQRWLRATFLGLVKNCPDVAVLVAGETVPEKSSEWGRLAKRLMVPHLPCAVWEHYIEQQGLQALFSKEEIQEQYQACSGSTKAMANFIQDRLEAVQ